MKDTTKETTAVMIATDLLPLKKPNAAGSFVPLNLL